MDVILFTHLFCALIYLALVALLARRWKRQVTALLLIVASSVTALWALAEGMGSGLGAESPPSIGVAADFLDILRLGGWIGVLGWLYRAGLPATASSGTLRWVGLGLGLLCVGLILVELQAGALEPQARLGAAAQVGLYGRLTLVTGGLVLVERLLREAGPETRFAIKYLCVGVGGILAYELFVCAEALLLQRVDPILVASRGALGAVAAPLIAVAAARSPSWSVRLSVSRRLAFRSVALVGVGIYMLGLGAAGGLLRAVGGDWGLVLQVTFFFAALVLLVLLLFSGTVRSFVKLQMARHFFAHRHDYREAWPRFVSSISPPAGGGSLRERALRAVAEIVDSPQGGLWWRRGEVFCLVAQVGLPEAEAEEPRGGSFVGELERRRERIIELDALDGGGDLQRAAWLPAWLRRSALAWLVIPLVHRDQLAGFIVLVRPRVLREFDWEDEDLLRIVARQAASYLAEEQATVDLEEARRFEEVSRRLSFWAHDLRNVANELALALANARKHIQNPGFQRDLVATMEESVEGMHRLLDKVRGRASGGEARAPTDLVELVARSVEARLSEKPQLRFESVGLTSLPIDGDRDGLAAVTGHLIRNAIEAVGEEGRVEVRLRRDGQRAIFEVADDGPGMAAEFVRERLQHPFRSSKPSGYGLGLYESAQLARELGGELEFDSEPGRGTVARLSLPLVAPKTEPPGGEQRGLRA